jgi:TolA-binding protein
MSDDQRRSELGQVVRISGDVRAAGAPWEVELQRALLEDGAALPGDAALLDRLCSGIGVAGMAAAGRSRLERVLRYVACAAVRSLSLSALALGLHGALGPRDDSRPASADHDSAPPARVAPQRDRSVATPATPLPLPLTASSSRVDASPQTPAQLFALAKQAQRAGNLTLAIARFESLQHRFPTSAEAHVSHVVLGSLLMKREAPGRALSQFQAYLARGGVLSEEALSGRARALSALGRPAEEARAWQTLLESYPRSVHADYARARLDKLRGQR